MKQYNVEVFDRNFNLLSHTNVSSVTYSEDYLSLVENEITLFNCEASKGDYIRIKSGDEDFFGIISSVSSQSEKLLTISYKSFLSIFDTDILFDTNTQGTSTLEQIIANIITAMFISNSDTSMVVQGLSVSTQGSTTGWGFNLKSDTENKHHCIINFFNVIIVRAMEKYTVRIKVVPNIQSKTIRLVIGKNPASTITIDSDLSNIIEKNIVLKETNNDVNKLIVYNTENYTASRTYYRHPDDSYDTINSNRITPVVQEIRGTAPEYDGDTVSKTFATMANSEAADVFGSIEYNNLIELVVSNNDTLINPHLLEVGQVVNIISKGKVYKSILTGKNIEDKIVLTFGTIRMDLTKVLKRRYN